jgi:hypothetical protein
MYKIARFEVLTVVPLKIQTALLLKTQVLWEMSLCRWATGSQCYRISPNNIGSYRIRPGSLWKRFLVNVVFNLFSSLPEIMKWTACWYMHIWSTNENSKQVTSLYLKGLKQKQIQKVVWKISITVDDLTDFTVCVVL